MGKGITHPMDMDATFDADEIQRLENQLDSSPLANEFIRLGIELIEDVARHRHAGLKRTQLQMWQGAVTDDGQRTIIGQHVNKRDPVGRRTMDDYKRLLRKESRLYSVHPVKTMLAENNAGKAFKDRGDLIVPAANNGIGKKFEILYTKRDTDPGVIRELRDAMLEVWEMMQKAAIASGHYTPFTDVNAWGSQIKSNANSGAPYYSPTSKDEMLNTLWPRFREWVFQIVNDDSLTDEKKYKTKAPDDANIGEFTAFTRSPNRLIWAVQLLSKLLGFCLNFNLTHMLAGLFPASWHGLDVTATNFADFISNAATAIYDDFDGYDLTFEEVILVLVLETFRESDFLSHTPDLRNAMDFLLYECTRKHTLRVSPTSTIVTPHALPSGSPVTQLIGIVVHAAVYVRMQEKSGLGVVGWEVLSDDGAIFVEESPDKVKLFMENEWADFVNGMGMAINKEKSFVADLDTHTYLGEMYGKEMMDHDCGAYLQQSLYSTPELISGQIGRNIASQLSMERDSSKAAMDAVLKQHGVALIDPGKGDIPSQYYHINRTINVLASIKPGHPLCDDLIRYTVGGFPKFEKRYLKFRDGVSDSLFEEDVLYAGGTLKSGMTPRWVVDYLDELIGGGDPTIWTATRLDQ